jgi:hypothetical protein
MAFDNRIGYRHIFGVLVPDFNSVVESEMAAVTSRTGHIGSVLAQRPTIGVMLNL